MRIFSGIFRDKKLGAGTREGRYDLPFDQGGTTGFLRLLIVLMSLLLILALAAFFFLNALSARWSAGLGQSFTVEIPAETATGALLPPGKVQEAGAQAVRILKSHPAIADARLLSAAEISRLIAPWLGEDAGLAGITLPGIISVTIRDTARRSDINMATLTQRLQQAAPQARIDTHESWLRDVLRFSGALQFTAFFVTALVSLTLAIAVVSAVRARMTAHQDHIEILHLIGAPDSYIGGQFQRHTLFLALQGGLIGLVLAFVILTGLNMAATATGNAALVPDFRLSQLHLLILGALPFAIAALAGWTARRTVLRALAKMP